MGNYFLQILKVSGKLEILNVNVVEIPWKCPILNRDGQVRDFLSQVKSSQTTIVSNEATGQVKFISDLT